VLRIALSNTMVVISGLDSENCDSGSQVSSYHEQENRSDLAPIFRTEMDFGDHQRASDMLALS